jgi:hypothetical protein
MLQGHREESVPGLKKKSILLLVWSGASCLRAWGGGMWELPCEALILLLGGGGAVA